MFINESVLKVFRLGKCFGSAILLQIGRTASVLKVFLGGSVPFGEVF